MMHCEQVLNRSSLEVISDSQCGFSIKYNKKTVSDLSEAALGLDVTVWI